MGTNENIDRTKSFDVRFLDEEGEYTYSVGSNPTEWRLGDDSLTVRRLTGYGTLGHETPTCWCEGIRKTCKIICSPIVPVSPYNYCKCYSSRQTVFPCSWAGHKDPSTKVPCSCGCSEQQDLEDGTCGFYFQCSTCKKSYHPTHTKE